LLFELIVVFLGVTAGFLLNNWQLEKKDQQLEQKYLNGFFQDVNENIVELQKAVDSDSLWLTRVKPKIMMIQEGTLPVDSANTLITLIVGISKVGIQTGTYEDIKNSGNLNIITDFYIKKQIVDYHVAVSGVEFVDEYFYKYFGDIVMPFVMSNFSVIKGGLDNPAIIRSTLFANVITGYYSMVQQRKTAYADLLDKSDSLRTELKIYASD